MDTRLKHKCKNANVSSYACFQLISNNLVLIVTSQSSRSRIVSLTAEVTDQPARPMLLEFIQFLDIVRR